MSGESHIRRVAIQGELGCNSHMAALRVPGVEIADIVSCMSSADLFERLEDGSVDLAVLPIENSLHGSVFEHYDLLLESSAHIVGEILLRVRHNLIAARGVPLSALRRVLSHPVALSQCRRWLRGHPQLEAVPFYDTAGSIKHLIRSGMTDTAGIAPNLAAGQYGAEILVPGIEDHAENYTRFYVLQKSGEAYVPGVSLDKASLAFTLEHRSGSLITALEALRSADLNLTKIESRPVPGKPWEYVFFVDVSFAAIGKLEAALAELRDRSRDLRELGRYAAAQAG